MTLKNGFGKSSLFVLSANTVKRSKHALFVFPPEGVVRLASRVAV